MESIQNLTQASEEVATTWFDARPEYMEMLIQDMRKKLGLHFLKEFKYVFDYTYFHVHPVVGLVPSYALENLGEAAFKAGVEPLVFYRTIWKSLWFCVIEKSNYEEKFQELKPIEEFDSLVKSYETEWEEFINDEESFLYGFEFRDFSNGKNFAVATDFNDVDVNRLNESAVVLESVYPAGYSDLEYSADVREAPDGRIFVVVRTAYEYLMEVASNVEAEKILKEIWG